MKPYIGHLEKVTEKNRDFRHVLFTGEHLQLVMMTLRPGEEIGAETHLTVDQFFRVEDGEADFVVGAEEHLVGEGDAVVVPAGTAHNVINVSPTRSLKLYTIYSPPQHPDGTVQKSKAQAMLAEERQ